MTRRDGYTLIELLAATASASVLLVGLSSALYISAEGLRLDEGASFARSKADRVIDRLSHDAQAALRYRTLDSDNVEFDMPDRTGDGVVDTVRYTVAGGGLLERTVNGAAAETLITGVRALTFESEGDTLDEIGPHLPDFAGQSVTTWPEIILGDPPTTADKVSSFSLPTPASVAPGDLLVAVVAVDKEVAVDIAPTGSWSEIVVAEVNGSGKGKEVTLGVWVRTAQSGEASTHEWAWGRDENAIGWIMTVINHEPLTPFAISETDTDVGKSSDPTCPSVTAATENSLVLRLGAFAKDNILIQDDAHMANHQSGWARNHSKDLSVAMAYQRPVAAGATGSAQFAFDEGNVDYVTITAAITPRAEVAP